MSLGRALPAALPLDARARFSAGYVGRLNKGAKVIDKWAKGDVTPYDPLALGIDDLLEDFFEFSYQIHTDSFYTCLHTTLEAQACQPRLARRLKSA